MLRRIVSRPAGTALHFRSASTITSTHLNLRKELFNLSIVRDPKVIFDPHQAKQRAARATSLVEHFTKQHPQQLQTLNDQELILSLDSVAHCTLSIHAHYPPLVDALCNELLKRQVGLLDLVFANSNDPSLLARLVQEFASLAVRQKMDAKACEELVNLAQLADAKPLTVPHFVFLFRIGEKTRHALLTSNEKYLVQIAKDKQLRDFSGLVLGSLAVEALLVTPFVGDDKVDQALQTVLHAALQRNLGAGSAHLTTKWIFQLFDSNQRRTKLDGEWDASVFRLVLEQELKRRPNFAFELSAKHPDYDLSTMALDLWAHTEFFAQFPCTMDFASKLAEEILSRMQRTKQITFPSVPYYLSNTELFLNSDRDKQVLQEMADLTADRMLEGATKEFTTARLERVMYDIQFSSKLPAVFDQVIFPRFAQSMWKPEILVMLLKFPQTPMAQFIQALENEYNEDMVLSFKTFIAFAKRFDGSNDKEEFQTKLLPKLQRLFPNTTKTPKYCKMEDMLILANMFADSAECKQKLWTFVINNLKQFQREQGFGKLVAQLGKLDTYEQDPLFQQLRAEKKLEFVVTLHGDKQYAAPLKPIFQSESTITTEASIEELALLARMSSADSDLTQATNELVKRLMGQPENNKLASKAVANALCLRLEKHVVGGGNDAAEFASQVQQVLPKIDLAFLCRVAGSAPTRALRDACLERVAALLPEQQLNAGDVIFAFNNIMPRFLSITEDATVLQREQQIVNNLAGQMLDFNLSNVPVKLMINALKTLQRIDESFPEFRVEYRDALLVRLAQEISQRTAEAAKKEDLIRAANILNRFNLAAHARVLAESLVSGPAGRELSTYLELVNAEDLMVQRYVLQGYQDIKSIVQNAQATPEVMDWVCNRAVQMQGLSLVELMCVAEWVSLNTDKEENGSKTKAELQFFDYFAQQIVKRWGLVEEAKLNSVDLISTFVEMNNAHAEVFKLALGDILQQADYYLVQSSAEDVNTLLQALGSKCVLQQSNSPEVLELVKQVVKYIDAHPRPELVAAQALSEQLKHQ